MAKRNILMKKKNGTVWDELYPITTANNVKVSSISGLTGTDVQSCLQNLFTFADNGKKNIATVIGSPLTSTDTFDSMKSKIQTLKNTFASNLTSKGQSSSGSDTLNNLINKIVNINTGRKWATGTQRSTTDSALEIQGLNFEPTIVIVINAWESSTSYDLAVAIYFKGIHGTSINYEDVDLRYSSGTEKWSQGKYTISGYGYCTVKYIGGSNVQYRWIAIE
ncbi:putative tail fiber protein [uncultured Caudovirales phage]|uniref:Putative tail fiber protein n=1 Tax=uncultured Caudovirales phage TaxID=2100421 RepID=A0A2H4J062_9CAUD|nr:putative tail fiber protein [uncultured Caudovirales phage]